MSQLSEPMTDDHELDASETVVTIVLLIEIIFRFAADWRLFHKSKRNWVDLGLAIITTVIQIPPIHRSGQAYAWLTIFQLVRIYRLVLAFPVTRDLIVSFLRTRSGMRLTFMVDAGVGKRQRYPELDRFRLSPHLPRRHFRSTAFPW